MYKYKDTKDAYTNDLVMWTNLPEGISNRIPYKVYLVKRKDGNSVEILGENNKLQLYGKVHGFKVLQTKPASQAKVGDYIFRLTEGPEEFPKGEIRKITEIDAKLLWYTSTRSVRHEEVVVITQAEENKQEKQKSYPYFIQGVHNGSPMIVRQDRDSYTYLHINSQFLLGVTFEGTHKILVPCDFTIKPEVDDIDWWQARFKAGLPVYAIALSGYKVLCKGFSPKEWDTAIRFSMTGNQSNTTNKPGAPSEQTQPTIKEQPMKLQQLLDAIFGVSDYEAKPKFIVTVFNNDKEVGTTTAESIEEIQQTIQSDTRLWGCKLVAYKIHSELQTQVPVAITKFKKESNATTE